MNFGSIVITVEIIEKILSPASAIGLSMWIIRIVPFIKCLLMRAQIQMREMTFVWVKQRKIAQSQVYLPTNSNWRLIDEKHLMNMNTKKNREQLQQISQIQSHFEQVPFAQCKKLWKAISLCYIRSAVLFWEESKRIQTEMKIIFALQCYIRRTNLHPTRRASHYRSIRKAITSKGLSKFGIKYFILWRYSHWLCLFLFHFISI